MFIQLLNRKSTFEGGKEIGQNIAFSQTFQNSKVIVMRQTQLLSPGWFFLSYQVFPFSH